MSLKPIEIATNNRRRDEKVFFDVEQKKIVKFGQLRTKL